MRKLKIWLRGGAAILLAAAVFAVQQFSLVPAQFTMLCGEAHSFPAFVAVHASKDGFLMKKNGDAASLTPQKTGSFAVDVSLLGLLRKTATIHVMEPKNVILGGQTVGIKLYMQGVMVVALSEIPGTGRRAPAKEAGIEVGDRVLAVDGVSLSGSDELEAAVEKSEGKGLTLTVSRGGKTWDTVATPLYYKDGESYKLGLWVRESAAGVGTLTFQDPVHGTYGALGHAIEDFETGSAIEPARGNITACNVAYITKSEAGAPGEICGVFGAENIGSIEKNTNVGLYGKMASPPNGAQIPIAVSTQVHTGDATIYTDVVTGTAVGYAAEIQEVFPQKDGENKCMVIRITDERLLRATGGIVQGMSGSPIVQNGKLVGAVTHVFVNDPTRGYGVYVENMLSEAAK